jgi:hypothetical protein
MRARGRRLAGRGGSDKSRGTRAIGARPDSIIRCGRAVTYGIDSEADAATSASAYRIGTAASDAERAIAHRMSKEESAIMRPETSKQASAANAE